MKHIKTYGIFENCIEPKHWIIFKKDDPDRNKVDSFDGTDSELREYIDKKEETGAEKFAAWTIEGMVL